ncbi:MAG TPA: glycosyltransferase family 1 protein [Flammeovirgaceae bacterium]|nr:glycosyltransferase family 1 protein [Flammeovirgaceae bacterium]
MKVAIVLNTSWNIYNFRMGLVKALLEEGHEVLAVAPRDEYTPKLVEAGCRYVEVKMDSRGANPLKDLGLIFELYRIYRKHRPDVVLQYTIKPNIYGTLAATMLRIPAINNVCGLGTAFLNRNMVSRLAITMYKLAFRFPKLVFFQNTDDREFFLNNGIIKKTATDVLPGSGIDVNKFIPAGSTYKNSPFTFLLISRLIHDKGILEYVEAIKRLKEKGVEARFQLLGQLDTDHSRGIAKELVDEWIEQGLVEYLGSTDDVRPYINNSDCVVLPSYREGTPRSLLEAASSGKPIVATNVAGCNNVVKHNENGYLCEVKNARDLAEKMEAMLKLPPRQREKMGKVSRQIVESRFDESLVIDKYLSSIAKV